MNVALKGVRQTWGFADLKIAVELAAYANTDRYVADDCVEKSNRFPPYYN